MSLNIGARFENWFTNKDNYNNLLNNGPQCNFSFVNRPMSTVANEDRADFYQKSVLNIAESRIDNYDTNKNKKMEFSEYVTEQANIYQKLFNEKLDLSIKGMKEMLKQTFDNCDTNKDGSIDNEEMSSVFAYMDGNSSNGKLDGNISYRSAMGSNWTHPDMPEVLLNLKNFIFGK